MTIDMHAHWTPKELYDALRKTIEEIRTALGDGPNRPTGV